MECDIKYVANRKRWDDRHKQKSAEAWSWSLTISWTAVSKLQANEKFQVAMSFEEQLAKSQTRDTSTGCFDRRLHEGGARKHDADCRKLRQDAP